MFCWLADSWSSWPSFLFWWLISCILVFSSTFGPSPSWFIIGIPYRCRTLIRLSIWEVLLKSLMLGVVNFIIWIWWKELIYRWVCSQLWRLRIKTFYFVESMKGYCFIIDWSLTWVACLCFLKLTEAFNVLIN